METPIDQVVEQGDESADFARMPEGQQGSEGGPRQGARAMRPDVEQVNQPQVIVGHGSGQGMALREFFQVDESDYKSVLLVFGIVVLAIVICLYLGGFLHEYIPSFLIMKAESGDYKPTTIGATITAIVCTLLYFLIKVAARKQLG